MDIQEQLLSAEEKKCDIYLQQKQLLDKSLEHGAISQAQHDKSLGDLTVKMSMEPNGKACTCSWWQRVCCNTDMYAGQQGDSFSRDRQLSLISRSFGSGIFVV